MTPGPLGTGAPNSPKLRVEKEPQSFENCQISIFSNPIGLSTLEPQGGEAPGTHFWSLIFGSAKDDPVRFKWGFGEGLLKDKFAFFKACKNPIP